MRQLFYYKVRQLLLQSATLNTVLSKVSFFSSQVFGFILVLRTRLAEFLLETNYLSDNSSKDKSEDEFWRKFVYIFHAGCENIEASPSHVETSSTKPSTFRLERLETDHPSKTNFPSVSTSSRRANRRISLRRILLYTWTNYPSQRDNSSMTDNSSLG